MDLLSLAEALEKPADTFVSVAVYVIGLTGPHTYKTKTDTERRYFCATVADATSSCLLRIYRKIPSMTPGASVFLKDALRKTGENQLWVVSSTKVTNWAPVQVPQAIIDYALKNGSTKKDGPTKLANAIKSNTSSNILAKVVQILRSMGPRSRSHGSLPTMSQKAIQAHYVVQTSPLKYRRNGVLPIKFLALQDCLVEGPVKIALFGEDAQRDFTEGDVLSVTETYRWKDTHTLSTKKSSKIEYLPQDSMDLPQMGPRFDDEDFTADSTNSSGSEPEEFQVMGVTSAHKYQCCPKSECRNKNLEDGTYPMCKGQSLTQQSYYCTAQVVLKSFPLSLCWACTIHKVQGLLTSSCSLDLDSSVFQPDMDLLSLAEALEKPADTFVSVAVYVIGLTGPHTYKTKTDTERRYFCATVADATSSCLLRIYRIIPSMTPGASVFLKDAIRKTGENQLWVVSSTEVTYWAPIQVQQAIIDYALKNGSTKKDGPTKLANAIKSNTSSNILAKVVQILRSMDPRSRSHGSIPTMSQKAIQAHYVVQTSPLKYRRNGVLPIKFLALQDCPDEGPVKIALFGEDAQRDFTEGDVLSVTETYRWKDTHTLSTKKSSKIEYLPQDSMDLPQMGPRFDDEDFTADSTNSSGSEPEEFQVMGVTSAHKYQCCPKSECWNKKLEDGTCPKCKGKSLTQQSYYCLAQVVLKRSMGTHEMWKLFKPDLELIVNLPDLQTMEEDPALHDFLTESLPINARGTFHNGKLTIQTAKRPRDC